MSFKEITIESHFYPKNLPQQKKSLTQKNIYSYLRSEITRI